MQKVMLIRALEDCLAHVESLVAAAHGNSSPCGVFNTMMGVGQSSSATQRAAVGRYVESWIEAPLRAALALANEPKASSSLDAYIGFLHDQSDWGATFLTAVENGTTREFLREEFS
jgi:hypothetical protein